jgi:DNA-binding MarR family transcriptional regulator
VTAPRWLTAEEQRVWRDYLDVSRRLTERLNRQLTEDSHLTLAEYEILVQLSEAPQHQIRMAELADLAVHSRSRLTHTVRRLEHRGLVRREECLDDRRGILCVLLDEGFATLEAAAPGHVEAVRSAMFDPLDAADVRGLGAAMCKLRAGLRAE